ncbi:flavin reductase family protein [Nocardia beijingensis]|uniref:flavin reductase family protein n=1 Tax=Nocardia beijingensis TaxID=95162 RepID=UPI002B4B47FC|nr:flavin reductase family protein [Nocardia beijingensis]
MTPTTITHTTIEPKILYFGTPVALISTLNEDVSANLSPMSSVFWLRWRAALGLDAGSKTPQNMLRTGESVLNAPSDALAPAVDRLALTTGSNPLPPLKRMRGYRYEPDKFGTSGLIPVMSETVSPPRVAECPVAMEAVVEAVHPLASDDPRQEGYLTTIEVRIQRVHVHDDPGRPRGPVVVGANPCAAVRKLGPTLSGGATRNTPSTPGRSGRCWVIHSVKLGSGPGCRGDAGGRCSPSVLPVVASVRHEPERSSS